MADRHLTSDDWTLIGFYSRVRDQYVNQTPMGTSKGPPITTLRLESVETALRLYRYPRVLWPWLADGAQMVHRLVTKQDEVSWPIETGKPLSMVTAEDVTDAADQE